MAVKLLKKYQNTIVQWLGLILVIVIFNMWSEGNLFSEYNIETMLETLTPLVIVSIGLTFVFAHGGMDISAGAVEALSALFAAYIINSSGSLLAGVLAAAAVSVICYIINSLVTNKFGLMAVITSLSIMFVARGIVAYICSKTPNDRMAVATVDMSLFKSNYGFMIGIIIFVIIISVVLFNFTKIGKGTRAIGDNALAARQNGIRVDMTKIICYIIAGIMVGIASIFTLASAGMVQSSTGNGFEMDVLVVLVLGGMSLAGGNSTRISSAVSGAFTYVILMKGLAIVGIDPNLMVLIKAIVFLIVIFVTTTRSKLKTMPR